MSKTGRRTSETGNSSRLHSPTWATWIALTTALGRFLWVVGSNAALQNRVTLLDRFRELDTLKDALFVLVISGLIWVLLRRYFNELRRATLALRETDKRWRRRKWGASIGM